MVSLEKYALAIATLSGLLLSCSDNLDDVSEDDLNPPGEIPADAEKPKDARIRSGRYIKSEK